MRTMVHSFVKEAVTAQMPVARVFIGRDQLRFCRDGLGEEVRQRGPFH